MVRVETRTATGEGVIGPKSLHGLTRYQEINGEHYIDLTTTMELAKGDRVLVTSDVDGIIREYTVWAIEEPHERDLLDRTYRCVWSLQAILSAVPSTSMPGTGGTPATARQALTALLSETDAFSIGRVEPTATGSASFWRMTAWEGLAELVSVWGGEVSASYDASHGTRTVDLLDRIGEEGAFLFAWGSSEIESVTRRREDGPKVCRVIPIGAAQETDSGGYGRKIDITSVNGGVPYLEDAQAAEECALLPDPHPTAYIENPEITDPTELKAWGQTVLHTVTRPEPEYDVVLVEKYARTGGYVPSLGDSGTIVDEALGISLTARVYAVNVDELAGSVWAVCSAAAVGLGAMAELVSTGNLPGAVTSSKGTTSASLLLTTTESPYTSAITAYDRGVYGQNVFWRPGGNLVIGSGEFADNMRNGGVESCTGTGEDAWYGSDGTLRLVSGANAIADRKTWQFKTNGQLQAPSTIDGTQAPSAMTDAGHYQHSYVANDHNVRSFARQSTTNNLLNMTEVGRYINGAWVWNTFAIGLLPDGTRMYSVSDPAAFREAIGLAPQRAAATADTAWISNASYTNFFAARTGNSAYLRIAGVKLAQALPHGSNVTVGTLPSGYAAYCNINGVLFNTAVGAVGMVSVSVGNIIFRNTTGSPIAAGTSLYGSVAYPSA